MTVFAGSTEKQHPYPQLFEPLQLSGIVIKNRLVFGAHRTNFAVNNLPGHRHLGYYLERARGEAGLIVMEEGIVHHSDYPYAKAVFAYKDEVVGQYAKIAEALHSYGTRVLLRLNHWGSQGTGMIRGGEVWGPSSVCVGSEMPKEMEREDMEEVVAAFARCAKNAYLAGVDGVELNAGQHSLLRQFLSPLTNMRQDEYGGTMENRARFCRQVMEQVRAETGENFIVGLRLTMDEYAPWAGITPEMGVELAAYLTGSGALDFLSVSVGSVYSLHMTVPSMAVEEGFTRSYGEMLKKAVNLPIVVGGRITTPGLANQILSDGQADLVELTRAQIADPMFAKKSRLGRESSIRPCLSCNEGCRTLGFQNKLLSCVVNWQAGREITDVSVKRGKGGKVAVIGGGPAGMEAASVAAWRGYKVDLFEKESVLGGNLRLACQVPGRGGLEKLLDFYKKLLKSVGVQIHLEQEITANFNFKDYGAVIVTTGAKARPPNLRGNDAIPVVSGLNLWQRGLTLEGQRLLLVDEDGFYGTTGLIEALAVGGKEITVVTSEMFPGIKLTDTDDFNLWFQRVKGLNVSFISHHRVKAIDGSTVLLEERFSGRKRLVTPVDGVICCEPPLPLEELYLNLKPLCSCLLRAGDCVAPRTLYHAIHEGYMAGHAV